MTLNRRAAIVRPCDLYDMLLVLNFPRKPIYKPLGIGVISGDREHGRSPRRLADAGHAKVADVFHQPFHGSAREGAALRRRKTFASNPPKSVNGVAESNAVAVFQRRQYFLACEPPKIASDLVRNGRQRGEFLGFFISRQAFGVRWPN